jgi:virulence factor Mce-like protein
MNGYRTSRSVIAVSSAAMLLCSCGFQGVNSVPLPGVVGRGPGAAVYHIELANVGTLESNSPVQAGDVVIGSVGKMTVEGYHANVEISVKAGVTVPANATATVGQTSLLGSMHLELNPPLGEPPVGVLPAGATIPMSRSSAYPSTEQTLSSLSAVVNGGGLGQIGDIIHSLAKALSGREEQVRDLITRLDTTIGVIDAQRDNIVNSINALNRLAGTFAEQRDAITDALHDIPPALDVLIREEPRLTTALDKLRTFSDIAKELINGTKADLVQNLKNLEPTLRALADIGPDLGTALAYAPFWPYSQDSIDRTIRGDYVNMFAVVDLTVPRFKRTLFLGTRWGQQGAILPAAPGDPWYQQYTFDPLSSSVAPQQVPPPPDSSG